MGCEGCFRIILIVFNILFFLVGAAALGVGIWVAVDGTIFLNLLAEIPDSGVYGRLITEAAYILIAAGGFIFLLAFFGCCGAWKKNKCLLMVYAVIIGILMLMEIGAVVLAYFFYDEVETIITTGLALALNSTYDSKFVVQAGDASTYDYTPGGLISKGIDAIQAEFSCCGVNNYTDYYNDAYPVSCCAPAADVVIKDLVDQLWSADTTTYELANSDCPINVTHVEATPGCLKAIQDYVLDKSIIFMAIGGGTLAVQIFLIIFACCVGQKAGNDDVEKM